MIAGRCVCGQQHIMARLRANTTNCEDSETIDTRKRPVDEEFKLDVTSKVGEDNPSNIMEMDAQSSGENVHLKLLIPSVVAGAIIGKGGETITQIQKESGATMKMSKNNDFYPGTNDRVCLITGTIDGSIKAFLFVVDALRSRPEPGAKSDDDLKVKILVPNSTAGMIIGKGGEFIRHIKEESGTYIQISQKSKEVNLPERCITISGNPDQIKCAVSIIVHKIEEDPQSSSCPNVSYSDFKGPVASASPTGSPFAHQSTPNNVNSPMSMNQMQNAGMNRQNHSGGAIDNLKAALRFSGFSEPAVEEISSAVCILASYGFLGFGMSLGLGGFGNAPGTNLSLANIANIMQGVNNPGNMSRAGPAAGDVGVFGPIGSTTMAGDNTKGSNFFAGNFGIASPGFENNSFGTSFYGPNQNSFGLGTNMGSLGSENGDIDNSKKEIEVGEHIVGAIIGPGGKGIVDIQKFSGAHVQISKKGVFAPGTNNRIVTITGSSISVQRADYFIQNRIIQEENKRARQEQMK